MPQLTSHFLGLCFAPILSFCPILALAFVNSFLGNPILAVQNRLTLPWLTHIDAGLRHAETMCVPRAAGECKKARGTVVGLGDKDKGLPRS